MGLTDKMNKFVGNVQAGAKNTSVSLILLSLKGVTAFLIAMTFAMIGQELINFGTFSFVFTSAIIYLTTFLFL